MLAPAPIMIENRIMISIDYASFPPELGPRLSGNLAGGIRLSHSLFQDRELRIFRKVPTFHEAKVAFAKTKHLIGLLDFLA